MLGINHPLGSYLMDDESINRLVAAGSSPRFETPQIDRKALAANLEEIREPMPYFHGPELCRRRLS
jgi:hypothetical protein